MKDLGEAKTIIGWEITRELQVGAIKIDQKGYIQDLQEFEGMSLCHPTIFPIKAGSSFTLNQARDHLPTDLIAYQHLIGKLMYLACETRPDIAFVVGQVRRHDSDPRIGHICITKQTLRYLKKASTFGIIWGKNPTGHQDEEGKYRSCEAVVYADSTYAEDINN